MSRALSNHLAGPLAQLLVDFEKAFNSMEWDYTFEQLGKLNFGPRFLGYVRLLYIDLVARVCISSMLSKAFLFERETRQGCEISVEQAQDIRIFTQE